MNVRHTLICFFFLSLQDGSPISVYKRTEGQDMSIYCTFSSSGNIRFFCKNECKEKGDLLIETTNVTAQIGRYRIEYETVEPKAYVSVSISQLTKSDSGRYRCGLNRSLSSESFSDFEVIVVDVILYGNPPKVKTFHKTTGDDLILQCYSILSGTRRYFCKEQCEDKDILVETTGVSAERDRYSIRYEKASPSGGFVYVNISQLTRSDSGLYRCGLSTSFSPDPYQEFRLVVTDALTTSQPISTLPIHGLNTGENSDGINMKVVPDCDYENFSPNSKY
ncbi:polymeric immunoglobulin receptor-like isoform X2 [Perca fluviatilis]|uniref:polymeric immunoglobulin receptor-like isoform X2 n=1 Tax=Perca fluviatilis TaxID=8168 RepID=UPI001965B675|nr:polymeric immunoglobulin receptor-like isoform X2 [Perca fluviatilis]